MGRISKISNPDFARALAEAYIDGCDRAEMAQLFGAHVDTISDWIRDPRVQKYAGAFARERALQIKRITDKELRERLKDADEMPVELLLKIRKEFLGRYEEIETDKAGDHAATVSEVWSNLEDDPELARRVKEWAAGKARSNVEQ